MKLTTMSKEKLMEYRKADDAWREEMAKDGDDFDVDAAIAKLAAAKNAAHDFAIVISIQYDIDAGE